MSAPRLVVVAACALAIAACGDDAATLVEPRQDPSGETWSSQDASQDYGPCVDEGRRVGIGGTPALTTTMSVGSAAVRVRVDSVGEHEWNGPGGRQWHRPRGNSDVVGSDTESPTCFRPASVTIVSVISEGSARIGQVGEQVDLLWLGDGNLEHGALVDEASGTRFGAIAGPVAAGEERIVVVQPRPRGFWQGRPEDPALVVDWAPLSYLVVHDRVRLADGTTVTASSIETSLRSIRWAPGAPFGRDAFQPEKTMPSPDVQRAPPTSSP